MRTTKSTRHERNSNNYGEPMETLRVGAAFPDPPFNGVPGNGGLDIDLMTEIAKVLGADVEFIAYKGTDFNGIFDELNSGA
jgi:polar amino acid transport system substrate-binding protein